MKRFFYFALFLVLFSPLAQGQIYTEDFSSGLPSDWSDFTEAGFDFVNWFDGSVSMFKQSTGDEIIMLASPSFDLSLYTRMEIDYYGFNLAFDSETVPDLHIGILESPGDFDSFRSIYELSVTNTESQVFSIDIGAYTQQANLCFKLKGERSQIIYLDNLKLYDDTFESNIPVAVTDVIIGAGTGGTNEVLFNWKNPGLEADGDPLQELNTISVRSAGEVIFEFDNVNIDEQQTFTDEVPNPGFYKFEIVPVNSFGDGHKVFSDLIWIGLDFPAASTNVQLERVDDQATLTWDAPTEGANGSFFDGIVESYTITRSDGKQFVVPGNENSFTDILDTQGSIRYQLQAENSSGLGNAAFSNVVFYTDADHLYYEDFNFNIVQDQSTSMLTYEWTTQSTANNSYWTWFSSNFIGQNEGEMSWVWTGAGNPNDMVRAVSPVINTNGFDAVSLDYNFYFEGAGASGYSVVIQTSSDGGNSWTDVEIIEISELIQGNYTKTIANADVGSDQFQFAFNRVGPANQNPFMRIDNIRLTNQPGTDLRATKLDVPRMVEPGTVVDLVSFVENNSSAPTSGLVELVIKERFASQSDVMTYSINYDDMAVGEILEETFGPWTAIEGEYIVELSITNNEDDVLDNNTITAFMNVFETTDRQLVILEEFSGTWCAFCPGAALAIEDLYAEGFNVGAITYHRGDDYETDIVASRMDKYGILGFPTTVFDGEFKIADGDLENSIIDQYRPVVEELQNVRSPITINFDNPIYSPSGEFGMVTADITSASMIENPNWQLVAIATESGIEESWQTLDVLDFVQRSYFETPIDLSTGSAEILINFPTDAILELSNAELIVFVQNLDDNQIINGYNIALSEFSILENTEDVTIQDVAIFPNPTRDIITYETTLENQKSTLQVYNTYGQLVWQESINAARGKLDCRLLPNGLYTIKITTANKLFKSSFIKQ